MTRDLAARRRWFATAALLDELEPADVEHLAAAARWVEVAAGAPIHRCDDPPAGLSFLVEGRVALGDAGRPPDGVVAREVSTPGYPLGWDGHVWPGRHRWAATARTDVRALHVDRDALDRRARVDPGFGARLTTLVLWLAGEQLRRQHTRLVARRYDDEVDAVADMITRHAAELRVTSPLHRVPAYLRTRPTLGDAFRALEALRDDGDAVERRIARFALDLLADVRVELRIYLGLQRLYEAVAHAPPDHDPERVRAASARALIDLFDQLDHRVTGWHHLPRTTGNLVIANHLTSHRDNRLPNGFSVILDTHFVASMILYRHSGHPPVRVVRDSHADEAGHAEYYRRLGYLTVPSVDRRAPSADERERRRRQFADAVAGRLRAGTDVVICPEGRTGPTAGSPRRFRAGVFHLAGAMDPEPLIVPVAVANFEQRLRTARLRARICPPFRMSEVVDDPRDRRRVEAFVNDELVPRYRTWVAATAADA